MKSIRLLFATTAVAAMSAGFSIAHAAAAAESSASSSEAPVLQEVIVTAQKRSERLHDVPMTITAQTAAQLDAAGVVSTRDLVTVVPGLTFTAVGAWQEPTIRGITTTANGPGQDAPVAIYVDGIYQANQVGNAFDTPDVSRIEVLKGPQGTLFGRNVVGGAITIYTLDPSFTPTGKFSLTDGVYFGNEVNTANQVYAKGFISGPLFGDTVAGSLAVAYKRNSGYLTNDVTGGRFGLTTDKYIHGKLLFQPTDNVKFVLGATYDKRLDGTGTTFLPLNGLTSANSRDAVTGALNYPERIIATRPYHTAFDKTPGIHIEEYSTTLRGDITIPGAGTLTTLTGYNYLGNSIDVDVDAAYAPSCLPTFACVSFNVQVPTKTVSQELDFASEKFGGLSFVIGANVYYSKSKSIQNANNGASLIRPDVTTRAYAVFGEANYDVTDRLTAVAGVRYSSEQKQLFGSPNAASPKTFQKEATWSSVTPRFSVRYRMTDDINAYATFSKGFKSGVLDTNTFTNNPLRPEKLNAYEAGLKVQKPNYTLSVAGFYNDYRDLQVSTFTGVKSFLQNAARVKTYGIDFDGTLQVTDQLLLRAGGEFLPYAKYDKYTGVTDYVPPLVGKFGLTTKIITASGMREIRAPKFTGNISADYVTDVSLGKLTTSATLSYSSSYKWDVLGTVRTNAYAILNGQLALVPTNSNFKFILFGRNLANKAYIEGAVLSANADAVAYSAPRQVGVTVEYNF
jgi:iron complex outermembrane receptor protein